MATRMHNPPHPGEVLQDTVLGDGRISVSEFARKLGVSRCAFPGGQCSGGGERGYGFAPFGSARGFR